MDSKRITEEELRNALKNVSLDTKIYFGCDSERYKLNKKWTVDYIKVIVIHIDGCRGCKIFAEIDTEVDRDANASKPFNRMLTEAMKIADLHNKFKDTFEDYEIYIHLDINPKKSAGSSVAVEAARGYVRSLTNVTPDLKPFAWAGSYAADRAKELNIHNN